MHTNRFEIRDRFYLDGSPFRIISGSIHYFRVVPAYWRDRLEKLRAMGCNTVETYVPWNLHEPEPGRFCFDGMLDLAGFLKTAQELGLWAIVRPSPYICAEWEFGGFPAWLLAREGMRVRCSYPPYLEAVSRYYRELFKVLAPLQIDRGGPVLLMQVENEYGSYGDETAYLAALRDEMRRNGVTVPLIHSDGPTGDMLTDGGVPGTLATANFGSKAAEQLGVLRRHLKEGPLMCTEFWVGWFDAWGDKAHHTTSPSACAKELDDILARGSVNIYMFHGGTNFGFMNGANYYDHLTPDVTSYDYDAPLSEDGRITEKYRAMREVIGKYAPLPPLAFSQTIERRAYGEQPVSGKVSLFSVLDDLTRPVESPWPLPMEALGQSYGYTLYRSAAQKADGLRRVQMMRAGDRAQIFLDGRHLCTLCDSTMGDECRVPDEMAACGRIDILTENLGRVNYGARLPYQYKGIGGAVLLNGHSHAGWRMYRLPLTQDMAARVDYSKAYREGEPAFYRVVFSVEKPADTFLDMSGWGKGCVLLDGFNLGRFWEIGPQKRLYIPAPLLRQGENELVIFETEGKAAGSVTFAAQPDLG